MVRVDTHSYSVVLPIPMQTICRHVQTMSTTVDYRPLSRSTYSSRPCRNGMSRRCQLRLRHGRRLPGGEDVLASNGVV